MSTGSKPSPHGRGGRSLHATYLRTPNGSTHGGYKAGELYGVYGHRTHAHKPCCRLITEGALSCPYCASGLVPEWRGYLPLWDCDWALRYVLIGPDIFESVDVIPHRAPVTVLRGKNPISPLIVREEAKLSRPLPMKTPWTDKVDMAEICCTLWKDDALTNWIRANKLQHVELPKGIAVKDKGEAFSPMMQAAAKKAGVKVVADDVAKVLDRTGRRMLSKTKEIEALKNGHADA